MPYAIFEQDEKLSRDFDTEADAWEQAEESGLVDDDHGKPVLYDHYEIKFTEEAFNPKAEWKLPKEIS